MKLYLIGSLRNPNVPNVAEQLRSLGLEVFDDWYAAGERADDAWKDYEMSRGHTYREGLQGFAANHVFSFDKHHLDTSDAAALVLPAGRSGHLELGYMAGQGKRTAILLSDEGRWDVMYRFADRVCMNIDELVQWARGLSERHD